MEEMLNELKIMTVSRAIRANKKLLKSNILGKNTKMKIYRTIIRPILLPQP